ncbi:hypothetical protein LWE69_19945 [Paenibacillus sp. UKAQ_18]|nr:hypothetical protein [Paenibacillus sp. UKAQ_18]
MNEAESVLVNVVRNPAPDISVMETKGTNPVIVATFIAGVISTSVIGGSMPVANQSLPKPTSQVLQACATGTAEPSFRKFSSSSSININPRRGKKEASNLSNHNRMYLNESYKVEIAANLKGTEDRFAQALRQYNFYFEPAYVNMQLNILNLMEETEMNNHFFDVVGDRLYKTAFTVFGAGVIFLPLLWLFKVIPSEVSMIGTFMSACSLIMFGGIKLIFRRNFPWI